MYGQSRRVHDPEQVDVDNKVVGLLELALVVSLNLEIVIELAGA